MAGFDTAGCRIGMCPTEPTSSPLDLTEVFWRNEFGELRRFRDEPDNQATPVLSRWLFNLIPDRYEPEQSGAALADS